MLKVCYHFQMSYTKASNIVTTFQETMQNMLLNPASSDPNNDNGYTRANQQTSYRDDQVNNTTIHTQNLIYRMYIILFIFSSPFQRTDWYQSFSMTSLRVDLLLMWPYIFSQMYTNTYIVDINYYLLHTGNTYVAK